MKYIHSVFVNICKIKRYLCFNFVWKGSKTNNDKCRAHAYDGTMWRRAREAGRSQAALDTVVPISIVESCDNAYLWLCQSQLIARGELRTSVRVRVPAVSQPPRLVLC